jgi:hypothetical protein
MYRDHCRMLIQLCKFCSFQTTHPFTEQSCGFSARRLGAGVLMRCDRRAGATATR